MTQNEIQQANIKELLKLATENPTFEIVPMVDSECIQSDGDNSWSSL